MEPIALIAAIPALAGIPAAPVVIAGLVGIQLAFGGGESIQSFIHGAVALNRHDPMAHSQMTQSGKSLAIIAAIAIGGGVLAQWGVGATF